MNQNGTRKQNFPRVKRISGTHRKSRPMSDVGRLARSLRSATTHKTDDDDDDGLQGLPSPTHPILGVSVLLPDRISARSQSHRRRAPAPQARCSGGCERSSLGARGRNSDVCMHKGWVRGHADIILTIQHMHTCAHVHVHVHAHVHVTCACTCACACDPAKMLCLSPQVSRPFIRFRLYKIKNSARLSCLKDILIFPIPCHGIAFSISWCCL